MIIYTYYEDILDDQLELIETWKKSWSKYGWTPIVLTRDDVSASNNDINKLLSLPSVNNKSYELSCYLRWKAMSKLGGWMCDYDVVNDGFTLDDALNYEPTSILQNHVPCLVYSDKLNYDKIFNLFLCDDILKYSENINNEQHISDMMVIKGLISDNSQLIKPYNIVVDYPNKSKLIHCSYHHTNINSISKIEAMKKYL